ncbi:MAG: hypothetical protein K5839_06610 [Treponemataceae bacterium]|nr:hypothetical protein [Treponemataceae bacterium]
MKKIILFIITLFIFFPIFAQEVVFLDQEKQSDTAFYKLLISYIEMDNPADKLEVQQSAKDFFALDQMTFENGPSRIALCVYYRNFLAEKVKDKAVSAQLDKLIKNYEKAFFDKFTNSFSFDHTVNLKSKKFRSLSSADYYFGKYNERFSADSQAKFSDSEFYEILNSPYLVYALFSSSKYENLKRAFINTLKQYVGEFDFYGFERDGYIALPGQLFEVYKKAPESYFNVSVLEYYELSSGLNSVYKKAVLRNVLIDEYFLPQEMPLVQGILADPFAIFALKSQTIQYLIERFDSLLAIKE